MLERFTRRDLFTGLLRRAPEAATVAVFVSLWPEHLTKAAEAAGLPFQNGKYQTHPRLEGEDRKRVLSLIDVGTLGPDTDTLVGVDLEGDIPTGALEIYRPRRGERPEETRVVFIKRTDLETVQLQPALGGDRFDIYQISRYGGDRVLDRMARLHAENTARRHQKVIYLGDLGLFEEQWGTGELSLLHALIRAQRPGRLDLGIPEPDFVNPRRY